MTDINDLQNRYFAHTLDVKITGEQMPDTSDFNQVEYLIDGHAYFGALRQEIANLLAGATNGYFYLANWWLGLVDGPNIETVVSPTTYSAWEPTREGIELERHSAFKLDDAVASLPMIDQLEQLAQRGIDVRVFAWVSPIGLNFKEAAKKNPYFDVNLHTLLSVRMLRTRQGMRNKVVLNTLAHSLGSMHLKAVLSGDDSGMRAYLSGLDPVDNRLRNPRIPRSDQPHWMHPPDQNWHDVGVKVQGRAAGAIYNYYRLLWNEQLNRDAKRFRISFRISNTPFVAIIESHTEGTPQLPERTPPSITPEGTQSVQVLRTAPQMHFKLSSDRIGCIERLIGGFRQDRLSFAPDGIFEFELALRKAIANAQRYIYIEDQSFWGLEIMEWINDRLIEQPDLKVIMLHGADPADPPEGFVVEAIHRLLNGRPTSPQAISNADSRIAFYERGGGVVMHSKVTIIDDEWVAVGSANSMRRSLYTDGELSIGVLDAAEPPFAKLFRKELWGEHCKLPPGADRDPLLDLDSALGIWNGSWGSPPAGIRLRAQLEQMELPFVLCVQAPGTITVTSGSDIVNGEVTTWDASLAPDPIDPVPHFLKVIGEDDVYSIVSVDTAAQQLRLDKPYRGTTGSGKDYKITQRGRLLLDALPVYNPEDYEDEDADSRNEF